MFSKPEIRKLFAPYELVQLYADRELARGFAFGADTAWQAEMEEAFPYEPTPDQRKAIATIAAKARWAEAKGQAPCPSATS